MKGLEALEEISLLVDVRKEHINKYLIIIEKELEDYEYLKQSNEELQKLNTNYGKRIDKLEKILEIIKEKMVDARALIEILEDEWTWEQYMDEEDDRNTGGHQFSRDRLTKNEFDLLREVLL